MRFYKKTLIAWTIISLVISFTILSSTSQIDLSDITITEFANMFQTFTFGYYLTSFMTAFICTSSLSVFGYFLYFSKYRILFIIAYLIFYIAYIYLCITSFTEFNSVFFIQNSISYFFKTSWMLYFIFVFDLMFNNE